MAFRVAFSEPETGRDSPPQRGWSHPRGLQHALKFVVYPMQLLVLNRLAPQQHYSEQRQLSMTRSFGEVHLRLCVQGRGIEDCDAMPMDGDKLLICEPIQNPADNFAY